MILTNRGQVAGFLSMVCLLAEPAVAGSYVVLHQFTGGGDGASPQVGVALDSVGNIYGTTYRGGDTSILPDGAGTIFKTDRSGAISTLHNFDVTNGYDSIEPLTLAGQTLFGSTEGGGTSGDGLVFSIRTDGSFYTVVHSFAGVDGYFPVGPLAKTSGRNLVGVTVYGGSGFDSSTGELGKGVLFGLSPAGKYAKLHDFQVQSGDFPNSVVTDSTGTIFGSTSYGGGCTTAGGCGVIYRFDPSTAVYTVLYSFSGGADGVIPIVTAIGADGTLYGTAAAPKGSSTSGTLFKLAPSSGGYRLTTLATFNHTTGGPTAGPTLSADGALVGASTKSLYAYQSGAFTILHAFDASSTGYDPLGKPATTTNNLVVGTLSVGGVVPCVSSSGTSINSLGCGALYAYVPGK